MAQNLSLDPVSQDYLLTASGSSIPTDDIRVASYIAISIPQGQWLYGTANQGSKLFTLNNVKRTASLEQQLSAYVTDAVDRQLISTGQATRAQVTNLVATTTGSSNQLEIQPAQVQLSQAINFTAV